MAPLNLQLLVPTHHGTGNTFQRHTLKMEQIKKSHPFDLRRAIWAELAPDLIRECLVSRINMVLIRRFERLTSSLPRKCSTI
jgi:hypothetical protein